MEYVFKTVMLIVMFSFSLVFSSDLLWSLCPGQAEQQKRKPKGGDSAVDRPVSHWRSRLTLNVVSEDFIFDRDFLPSDVHRYLRV